MCGRFTQKTDKKTIEKEFDIEIPESQDFKTSYNVAPTQLIGAIRIIENAREYTNLKWGLIPSWSKDDSLKIDGFSFPSDAEKRRTSDNFFGCNFVVFQCPVDAMLDSFFDSSVF